MNHFPPGKFLPPPFKRPAIDSPGHPLLLMRPGAVEVNDRGGSRRGILRAIVFDQEGLERVVSFRAKSAFENASADRILQSRGFRLDDHACRNSGRLIARRGQYAGWVNASA